MARGCGFRASSPLVLLLSPQRWSVGPHLCTKGSYELDCVTPQGCWRGLEAASRRWFGEFSLQLPRELRAERLWAEESLLAWFLSPGQAGSATIWLMIQLRFLSSSTEVPASC